MMTEDRAGWFELAEATGIPRTHAEAAWEKVGTYDYYSLIRAARRSELDELAAQRRGVERFAKGGPDGF